MMKNYKILVITSCTGKKKFNPPNKLFIDDFRDINTLKQRESELEEYKCKAIDMYTGMQHINLVEGLNIIRDVFKDIIIDVNIISAGYGLLKENDIVVPYEVTFNNMKSTELNEWSNYLNVHNDTIESMKGYDIVIFLLGGKYLKALQLPLENNENQRVIFLETKQEDATSFSYGLVGLKGYLMKLLFKHITENGIEIFDDIYNNPKAITDILNKYRKN